VPVPQKRQIYFFVKKGSLPFKKLFSMPDVKRILDIVNYIEKARKEMSTFYAQTMDKTRKLIDELVPRQVQTKFIEKAKKFVGLGTETGLEIIEPVVDVCGLTDFVAMVTGAIA